MNKLFSYQKKKNFIRYIRISRKIKAFIGKSMYIFSKSHCPDFNGDVSSQFLTRFGGKNKTRTFSPYSHDFSR